MWMSEARSASACSTRPSTSSIGENSAPTVTRPAARPRVVMASAGPPSDPAPEPHVQLGVAPLGPADEVVDRSQVAADQLPSDLFLAGEVVVEGGLGDAQLLRDRPH